MAELIMRKGTAADAAEIEQLEKICFADPWSMESLMHELTENPLATYIVAEFEGHVIGYVGVWSIVDEGHITNVAVSPDYRRMQVGSALIKTMIEVTEKAGIGHYTLEVRAGNEPAKSLYRKFGFVETGLRRGYYEDNGEDAILMWRNPPI